MGFLCDISSLDFRDFEVFSQDRPASVRCQASIVCQNHQRGLWLLRTTFESLGINLMQCRADLGYDSLVNICYRYEVQ